VTFTACRDAADVGVVYNMTVSARLGRTDSKEQYAYLYRTDTVELTQPLQHQDTSEDVFEREPYSVLVRSRVLGAFAI
jgi:deoxyribonuclease-1/deoxyribonuclease-1-like protein